MKQRPRTAKEQRGLLISKPQQRPQTGHRERKALPRFQGLVRTNLELRLDTGRNQREDKLLLFRQVSESHSTKLSRASRPESAPIARSPTKNQSRLYYSLPRPETSKANKKRDPTTKLTAYLSQLHRGEDEAMERKEEPEESDYLQEQRIKHGNLYTWKVSSGDVSQVTPQLVFQGDELSTIDILDLDCTETSAVVVLKGGKAYQREFSQSVQEVEPISIPTAMSIGIPRIARIACGQEHTIALLEDGSALGWGSNARGQLGLRPYQATTGKFVRAASGIQGVHFLEEHKGRHFYELACGDFHTVLVDASSRIFAMGAGGAGQLGVNQRQQGTVRRRSIQHAPLGACLVRQVACGSTHSMVLLESGKLYITGEIGFPQMNSSDLKLLNRSLRAMTGNGSGAFKIDSIGARKNRCFAISTQGELLVWQTGGEKINSILLDSIWKAGVRMRSASFGFNGKLVAVSFASNVYYWDDPFNNKDPTVMKRFATDGIRVNIATCGLDSFLAGRKTSTTSLSETLGARQLLEKALQENSEPSVESQNLAREEETSHDQVEEFESKQGDLNLVTPEVSVKKSVVWGSCLSQVEAGTQRCVFQLELKDADGRPIKEREEFEAVCGTVVGENGGVKQVHFLWKGNGRADAWFSAAEFTSASKPFTLSLTYRDKHLGKSPYEVLVRASKVSTEKSHAKVVYVEGTDLFSVQLEERDRFGNYLQVLSTCTEQQKKNNRVRSRNFTVYGQDSQGQDFDLKTIRVGNKDLFQRQAGLVSVRVLSSNGQEISSSPLLLETLRYKVVLSPRQPYGVIGHEYLVCLEFLDQETPTWKRATLSYSFQPQGSTCQESSHKSCSSVGDLFRLIVPQQAGQFVLTGDLELDGVKYDNAISLPRIEIFSNETLEFAMNRRLGCDVNIEAGFTFVPMVASSDGISMLLNNTSPTRIEVDAGSDPVLARMSNYCIEVCCGLKDLKIKARLLCSILNEWTHSMNVPEFLPKEFPSRVNMMQAFSPAILQRNEMNPSIVKAVLYKFLAYRIGLGCEISLSEGKMNVYIFCGEDKYSIEIEGLMHELTPHTK